MIICVCHNVSERKIRKAVKEGLTTMPALRENLGVGTCCGKCHSCAKTVLRECLEACTPEPQTIVFEGALAA